MKQRIARLLLFVEMASVLLCGCISNVQPMEETQITLMINANSFDVQDASGNHIAYDGEHLEGTMIWELLGNVEGELWFEIPDSSSFSGKCDEERYAVTLENQEYSRGFSAAGVQEFQLSKENGIVLNGTDITYKLSMDTPSLPGSGLIRFQGCAEKTVQIKPADKGFHISGAVSPLFLTITNSELGTHDANIVFQGTEIQLDFSKLVEGVVTVTDSDGVSTQIHTNYYK